MIFDEDTPHEIVAALQPDVLVKGADWASGRDRRPRRRRSPRRPRRIPVVEGYSTSKLIERIKET